MGLRRRAATTVVVEPGATGAMRDPVAVPATFALAAVWTPGFWLPAVAEVVAVTPVPMERPVVV